MIPWSAAAMKSMVLALGIVVTAPSAAPVAAAETPAGDERNRFRFEFEQTQGTRGRAVEGWVYNDLPWRVTNVRLRVDCVDANGTVIASAAGWALGDVPAGGRGYFYVPTSSRATAYHLSVQSFDKVGREAPPQAP